MAEPLRHRQTKEAETDMFSLQPPRHISTLPSVATGQSIHLSNVRFTPESDIKHALAMAAMCQGTKPLAR